MASSLRDTGGKRLLQEKQWSCGSSAGRNLKLDEGERTSSTVPVYIPHGEVASAFMATCACCIGVRSAPVGRRCDD